MISSAVPHIHGDARIPMRSKGRAKCQKNRNLGQRGCPFGGYFFCQFQSGLFLGLWNQRKPDLKDQMLVVHSVSMRSEKRQGNRRSDHWCALRRRWKFLCFPVIVHQRTRTAFKYNLILLNSTFQSLPITRKWYMGWWEIWWLSTIYRARFGVNMRAFWICDSGGKGPIVGIFQIQKCRKSRKLISLRGYAAGFSAEEELGS